MSWRPTPFRLRAHNWLLSPVALCMVASWVPFSAARESRQVGGAPIQSAASQTPDTTALLAEYEAADMAWNKAWRALSGKERRALKKVNPAADFLKRFEGLAERGSGLAQLWLALHLEDTAKWHSKELAAALDGIYSRLIETHVEGDLGPKIAKALVSNGRRVARSRRITLLEEISKRSPDHRSAALALSKVVALLDHRNASDEDRARAERVSETLLDRFLDTPEGVAVWGLRNRNAFQGVGNKIPDFPAVDTEGKTFRISEYEGQVVLLDFWGFW